MKNSQFLMCILTIIVGCTGKTETLVYKKSITTLHATSYLCPDDLTVNKTSLPNDLSLHMFEGTKSITTKLPFLSNYGADNYVYGQKKIFNNTLIVYSSEYDPYRNDSEVVYGHIVGFLLLVKNDRIIRWLKIYDSGLWKNRMMNSYLFENYVITIYCKDENYDVVVEGEEDTGECSFTVTEITETGEMVSLNEDQGRVIGKKYLSTNKLYKGKF